MPTPKPPSIFCASKAWYVLPAFPLCIFVTTCQILDRAIDAFLQAGEKIPEWDRPPPSADSAAAAAAAAAADDTPTASRANGGGSSDNTPSAASAGTPSAASADAAAAGAHP